MPLIEVDEPYAAPPRLPTVRPGRSWSGAIELDRGLGELTGVELDDEPLDLDGCEELAIDGSIIRRVALGSDDGPELDIRATVIDGGDLSQARVVVVQRSRLLGCKLTGTDLSTAAMTDVELVGCSLRYTNLRMARLKRVRFVDCTIDEVDGFQLEATDVSFDGCRISALNVDRLTASGVDFRRAVELGLSGAGRLEGCLVADHQLPALAPMLALAVGLDLER